MCRTEANPEGQMKLFAKLMITGLVIAMLLPFTFLKNEDGGTLLSFSDFSLPDFSMPEMPDARDITPTIDGLDGQDIFYKWYDAEGNVQFTTELPPDGLEYTIKGFDPDTNVIRAVKLPHEASDSDGTSSSEKTSSAEDFGNPYTKESIEKLFKDTKNIEKMLKQRLQNQNSEINQ